MEAKALVNELNIIFWNTEMTDDEVANQLLELMDNNKETIEFDSALKEAHTLMSRWSRTEQETGTYLDEFREVLELNPFN